MQKSIRTNVWVNLIRTITMTILSFVTFPYITRVLGESGLGMYNWAVAFVYYFLVLARISIPNIAVRELVRVKDDKEAFNKKVHEFFIIQLITTLISFGLMCIVFFITPAFRVENALPIVFILSLNFLVGVFSFEWLYTALEKQKYMAIRSMIIAVIVDVLIFVFITSPDNIVLYTFFCVLTTILTVITNLFFLPKVFKFSKPGKLNLKQYIPMMAIMAAISVVLAIYDKTDSFILGLVDPSKRAVGSYTVGIKVIEIVIGIITALSTVFIPRAADEYNKGNIESYKNINAYSFNIALFIVVPSIAFLISETGLGYLLTGWNQNSQPNAAITTLASITLTFSLSYIIYTQILIPQKKEKLYLLVMSVGVLLNIGLSLLFSLVLLKEQPVMAVALATALTDALILITLIILTWDDVCHAIFNKNTLKIFIIGALTLVASYFFIIAFSNLNLILEIVLVFICDSLFYLLGLLLTKEKLILSIIKRQ